MTGTDTELERRLRDLGSSDSARLAGRAAVTVNTERAWRELRDRRGRSAAHRRRGLVTAAVAAVVAVLIAVPVLSRVFAPSQVPVPARTGRVTPGAPKSYPGAITARMPISGVVAMASDGPTVFAVRQVGPPGLAGNYQLVAIDLAANSVSFRVGLGRQEPAIAAGPGVLWLTTSDGRARGQIVSIDPNTGRVLTRYHLPAGPCTALTFAAARLYATCNLDGGTGTAFWWINWRTDRATRINLPLHGYVSSTVGTARSLWYVIGYTAIRGVADPTGKPRPLSADWGGYEVSPGGQGLVYASGSIWALAAGEQLARIDPANGRVQRVYTYRDYDPSRLGGLNFLTAGGGWLWFLDNGYPFSGVLRVSMATGHPAGGVPVPPNSCGQQTCSQVYYEAGSVWVPTAELLLRIDPGRLPG